MESAKKCLKGSIEKHFVMTSKDKMVIEDNGVSSQSSSVTREEECEKLVVSHVCETDLNAEVIQKTFKLKKEKNLCFLLFLICKQI